MNSHWAETQRRITDVSQRKEESTDFLHGLKQCWSNVQLVEGRKHRIHLGCQRGALGIYFPFKTIAFIDNSCSSNLV